MKKPRHGTFIDGLPEIKYHNKDHGYSSSDLKKILAKSPEHFRWSQDQPYVPPTEAMRIGSVMHCGLLRPEAFEEEIVQLPVLNLKKKADREVKELFIENNSDKLVVNQKELDLGLDMVKSMQGNDLVMEILEDSIRERSMYADVLGTPFRARPDSYKGSCLHEVKSTRDASPEAFSKQIANLNYHVSLIHYAHLMAICDDQISSMEAIEYKFIVVENTPPHSVAVYIPSERMLYVGFEKWKEAVHKLQGCLETDIWNGFNEDGVATEIDLPNWAVPAEEA